MHDSFINYSRMKHRADVNLVLHKCYVYERIFAGLLDRKLFQDRYRGTFNDSFVKFRHV